MIILRLVVVFTILVFSGFNLFGQVTSTNYQLTYNEETCNYDCYLVIKEGSATSSFERIQASSQYSIIVPTGTALSIVDEYMPLVGNSSYDGTTPITWQLASSVISPTIAPELDFYGITPVISPVARYNDLHPGDKVKLFSVSINNSNNCSPLIRLYENGVDPTSSDPGMGNGDFSNGFVISPFGDQVYTSNDSQVYPEDAYVNTENDLGEESLRFLTTQDCCIDTIYFNSSTNGNPIILNSEIELNSEIVIIGNGIQNTIIDGQNAHRIFSILSNGKLSLSNMTIQNTTELTNGGAIYNQGDMILNNVLFKNNFEVTELKSFTNKGNVIIEGQDVIINN